MPTFGPTRLLTGLALTAALVAIGPAGTSSALEDRADAAGPLDIASATVAFKRPPVRLSARSRKPYVVFTVRTFEPWSRALLSEQSAANPNYVGVQWGRDKTATRCIETTRKASGRLVATLRKRCGPLPTPTQTYPAGKPNGRTLRIRASSYELGSARWWRAVTSFEAPGDPECPAPEYPAPEQQYGACVDTTPWARLEP